MAIDRNQVPYTAADPTQAIFGLGIDETDATGLSTAYAAADTAAIAAHAATDLAAAVHGLPKVSVVDGEDETTTHKITVTGMAAGDIVTAVLVLTTKASIATLAAHAGTLTAAADKITPGTEVDNTGNQYIIFWIDTT